MIILMLGERGVWAECHGVTRGCLAFLGEPPRLRGNPRFVWPFYFFFCPGCAGGSWWCGVRCAVVCGRNGGLLDVGWVVRCDWGKWGLIRFLRGFWVNLIFFCWVVEGFAMLKSEKGRGVTREAWTWSDLPGVRVRVHAFCYIGAVSPCISVSWFPTTERTLWIWIPLKQKSCLWRKRENFGAFINCKKAIKWQESALDWEWCQEWIFATVSLTLN